jgi:VWFA-related protein
MMLRIIGVGITFLSVIVCGQHPPTFRTEVSLVHVDAGVTENNGRILTGLSQDDFRAFDEGQAQVITGFLAEEQPLDLILLFDISGSMHTQVARIAGAAREAFRELREGDRVAVMTFTSKATVVSPFTTNLESIEHDIQGMLSHRFRGSTQIREGIYEAANYFIRSERTQRRRAILVITDNMGGHKRSEAEVVTNLWEADAVLSGIVVPPRRARGFSNDPFGPIGELLAAKMFAGIDGIAQKTGGDALHSDDPRGTLSQMMHRIRSRYSLYYRMPYGTPGSFRSIRVELASGAQARFPGAHVSARRGYRLMQP